MPGSRPFNCRLRSRPHSSTQVCNQFVRVWVVHVKRKVHGRVCRFKSDLLIPPGPGRFGPKAVKRQCGLRGFAHIPFRIRNASKGQIVRIMTSVHMTQQDLERWQKLVQCGQWNYQDPPLDEWRSSALQKQQQYFRVNTPTENSDMTVANPEQILSLNTEDLLLVEEQFVGCKWTSKEPDTLIAFGNDQIQGLTKEP